MENPNVMSTTDSVVSEDSVNLRHYWHIILERRWLVITAFISVFVLALIYLYKAPRIYQAVARLQIDREDSGALNIRQVLSVDGREQDYLQTQYKNLQSRTLIETVINQLELGKDARYAKRLDVSRAVADDVTIAPIRLSRLVDIKVEHPQPEMAARIANSIVTNFIQNNLDQKIYKLKGVLEYLSMESKELANEVEKADAALQAYRTNSEMGISLAESENVLLQGLKQAQGDFTRAQSEATSFQNMADGVKNLIKEGTSKDAIPEIANNLAIRQLHNELASLKAELAALLTRYKDKWPAVEQKRKQIGSLEASIESESENLYQAIQTQAQVAKQREDGQKALLDRAKQEMLKLGNLRIKYDVLNRQAERAKELYNLVLQKTKETDLTTKDKTQNMSVVDAAKPPYQPIKPRIVLTLILGVLGGLAVAGSLAFFVNYLDDSIKIQDDVETYLRLPFLGYVPNIKTNSLVERELQSHLHPRSNAAEGFRTIRAAISLMPKAEKYRSLAVTSTIPSEGKSLVAANLAIVIAQTGMKTLLVDADLRRPSVHKAFQLHSPLGLSAYLTQEVESLDDIAHSTEVPNLDVVCCGSIPSSPSELISSRRMEQFLSEVRGRYDRIILDCPPVSAVSDPLVLAARADGVVFVTKFNKIRRHHARRSVQRIQDAGIFILGVVLNDIDFEGKDSYYYSYYYYQNRYYSSHYKTEPDGKGKDGKPKAPAAVSKDKTTV
jgi:succinoglycan biosynthesis transport protein ExoP